MLRVDEELEQAKNIIRNVNAINFTIEFLESLPDEAIECRQEQLEGLKQVREFTFGSLSEVRVIVAAGLLGLSVPTTNRWAKAGILEIVEGSKPTKVPLKSVLEILPHIEILRELGQKRNLLEAVLARIDDYDLLAELGQEGSLEYKESELIRIA